MIPCNKDTSINGEEDVVTYTHTCSIQLETNYWGGRGGGGDVDIK